MFGAANCSVASRIAHKSLIQNSVSFIDGAFSDAYSTKALAVFNPATGVREGDIPSQGKEATAKAIEAASTALPLWRDTLPTKRADLLRRLSVEMKKHAADLARIMTMECGKPFLEAMGENAYSAGYVDWYAGEAERVCGDLVASPRPGVRSLVMKQPCGVVGVITPWNFPSAMITRSAAAALAAGCTVVIKPSELTPFSAGALAQLVHEVGIPKGVFNVVTGEARDIGRELLDSNAVRKICFTGSTRVGKYLMSESAHTVKKLAMELGGNAPFIVFPDADISSAATAAIASKFRNAGQTCVCANRFLVHVSVADAFVAEFAKKAQALVVGDGSVEGTTMGPLITRAACDRMESLVQDAVSKGATVVTGGHKVKQDASHHFFQPTVLSHATPSMKVFQEEIFGPIAPVVTFKTDEEAIQLANAVPVGLASYFFTNDYRRQWRMSEKLDYGMVGVNEGVLSSNIAPFGGVKQSGLGRDGSKYGIEGFLDIKYVCMGGGI